MATVVKTSMNLTKNELDELQALLGGGRRPRYSPFLCLCGLSVGVFPGVSLLSRRRLSGLPVDLAVGFGPGLMAIIALLAVAGNAAAELF